MDILYSIYIICKLNQMYFRYVEGGKYIETHTSCGTIWGRVDAQNRFSFTGIPYSVQVRDI